MELPLGQRENERLEFKSAAALEQPHRISSEAVAMLNAEGGEIWIGITEDNGRATKIDSVGKPDSARRSLLDHLVDTIEPAPTGGEIQIEIVRVDEAFVLRLTVRPDARRSPYCQLRSGSRRVFLRRIADRTRPMPREEIAEAFRRAGQGRQDELTRAAKNISKERSRVQTAGEPILWVCLQPVPNAELPVEDPSLGKYLTDHSASGNSRLGVNFVEPRLEPKPEREKLLVASKGRFGCRRTEIFSNGGVVSQTSLSVVSFAEKKEIHPLSLLEYPTSLLRLGSALYREFPIEGGQWLLADMALIQIQGWRLRPGSPGASQFEAFSTRFEAHDGRVWEQSRDLVWDAPLRFELRQAVEEPDRCGMRLVRRVYQAFGYFEDAIPWEFDRDSGRLVLG